MDRRKLAKLRRLLEALRRGQPKARELQSLARQLGRKPAKNRGKEPMWESTEFDELFVLAIPNHKGRDMAPVTINKILNQLEGDISAWEERLLEDEDGPAAKT